MFSFSLSIPATPLQHPPTNSPFHVETIRLKRKQEDIDYKAKKRFRDIARRHKQRKEEKERAKVREARIAAKEPFRMYRMEITKK